MPNATEIDTLFAAVADGRPVEVLEKLALEQDLPMAARVLRGIAALDALDLQLAAVELTAVLEAQPDNPPARHHLALVRFRQGDREEAARLLRSGPLLPQPAFLVRFLRIFWPIQFKEPSIRLPRAESLPDEWPHRQEVESWLSAPESLSAGARRRLAGKLTKAARAADKQKHHLLAEHLFGHAAALDPANVDLRFTLAHMHLELGRNAEALEIMNALNREAIAANTPLPPQAIVLHAWALHASGEHEPALLLLSRVRPQGPDDFLAHIVAAVCWDALGNRANADRNYQLAFGGFFIESWLGFTKPYLDKVVAWMMDSKESASLSD
jgi:thioredoxin-like negative regulator of GroEL